MPTSPITTLDDLLALLGDVRPDGSGYLALCPAHADHTPSLIVGLDPTGRVGIYCRAGCKTPQVLEALGLGFSDLYDVEPGTAQVSSGADNAPPTAAHLADLGAYATEAANAFPGSPASVYAFARFGIDEDLGVEMGLGYDGGAIPSPYFHGAYRATPRLVVPFRGFDGVVRGLQSRALDTDPSLVRWCGPSNPAGHRWSTLAVWWPHPFDDDVLVTEGPGDALAAVGAGFNAVAIRGAALGRNASTVEMLTTGLGGARVIMAGDNDRAGEDFNTTLSEALAAAGVQTHVLGLPTVTSDLADWRRESPSTFSDDVQRAIRAAPRVGAPSAPTAPPSPRPGRFTHRAAAEAFVGRHPDLVYNNALGWLHYRRGVWEPDHEGYRLAAVEETAAHLQASGEAAGDDDMERWARRLNTTTAGTNSILAQAEGLAYQSEQLFDLHDHLLAVANGTVNLRSGELIGHDPAHYLTRRVEVEFHPDARAPRWDAFLAEVFEGEPDLPCFIQRLVGYGITGSNAEACFAVFFGKGANGKSVLTSTLDLLFDSISWTTPFSTFEARQTGSGSSDLAALRGARLCWAQEGEARQRMAEATLKRVTGGDRVQAAHKYRDPFVFRPRFLLVMASNYRPDFRGVDEGLWRRVKLVPFARFFRPEERDHYLGEKLRDEFEGILAWAIKGAGEWYATGLDEPPAVVKATLDYRETSDDLADFIGDTLIVDPDASTKGLDVSDRYGAWCAQHGEKAMSARALYAALTERLDGVRKERTRTGQTLVGLRLVPLGGTGCDDVTVLPLPGKTSGEEESIESLENPPRFATSPRPEDDEPLLSFEDGDE